MHAPKSLIALVAALCMAASTNRAVAEDPVPKFPEIGKDYAITFVEPMVSSDSGDPFSRSGRLIVFTRHIRGDWYEVAFLLGGGISKSYLNLDHVVTIEETDRKHVSESLKRLSEE